MACNTDAPATVFSLNAAQSNYITLQTSTTLSENEKQELRQTDVEILEYVSDNTYLCRYEPAELDHIKIKPYIRHVAEYDNRFKTDSFLKDTLHASKDRDGLPASVTTDVELHQCADRNLQQTKADLAEKIGVPESEIAIKGDKLSIAVEPQQLPLVESLDSVKSIYEAVPTSLCNNFARHVLHAKISTDEMEYTGKSQVIAIADTGFDTGSVQEPHPAFTGRVKELLAVGRRASGQTDDKHGHGTHVCGSVLGNGYSESMGGSLQGTAPDAELVMQSLWTGNNLQTSNILDLFVTAYERGARVYNNS